MSAAAAPAAGDVSGRATVPRAATPTSGKLAPASARARPTARITPESVPPSTTAARHSSITGSTARRRTSSSSRTESSSIPPAPPTRTRTGLPRPIDAASSAPAISAGRSRRTTTGRPSGTCPHMQPPTVRQRLCRRRCRADTPYLGADRRGRVPTQPAYRRRTHESRPAPPSTHRPGFSSASATSLARAPTFYCWRASSRRPRNGSATESTGGRYRVLSSCSRTLSASRRTAGPLRTVHPTCAARNEPRPRSEAPGDRRSSGGWGHVRFAWRWITDSTVFPRSAVGGHMSGVGQSSCLVSELQVG